MREALLFIDITEKIDRDVYTPTDYSDLKGNYRMFPSNSGNKLWLDAIEEYICQDKVKYSYYSKEMSFQEINDRFEYILAPMANLINIKDKQKIIELTTFFEKITIPVYIVGLGAQVKNERDINKLIREIGIYVSKLIDAVLSTGGKIGLRGNITKEILFRLGFEQPIVIGCPSMFVNGADYKILKRNFGKNEIIPVVNGDTPFLNTNFSKCIFDTYKDAIYIDQETFRELLYLNEHKFINYYDLFTSIHKFSYMGIELFSKNRIRLFYDIPIWKDFLIKKKFNFCVGTRIHGSIISLLCGIPTAIIYKDLRVKEMAEYLCIPSFNYDTVKKMELYELYNIIDYKKFNENYSSKYKVFKEFFDLNGIANSIGDSRSYKEKISSIKFSYPPEVSKYILSNLSRLMTDSSALTLFCRLLGGCLFNLKHITI